MACRKSASDSIARTKSRFDSRKEDFETVRRMLEEDHGLVTKIVVDHGQLSGATGAKGTYSSEGRSGFPWSCRGEVVVKDEGEAEAFFGLPAGRLRAYAKILPARAVMPDPQCAPEGSLRFILVDPDASPCTGFNDVV